MQSNSTPRVLLAAVAAVLVWSAIGCHDMFTWFLEVVPVLIGVPWLIWLYPRFRFTNLVYALIAVHAAILMIGGHYTYALMPVFQWIKDWLHLDRNYYDRLGHFAQGFVPAFIAPGAGAVESSAYSGRDAVVGSGGRMEIIGVTDGALRIETGGDTLPLSAGQFCLIPAPCPASAARATEPVSFLEIYAG